MTTSVRKNIKKTYSLKTIFSAFLLSRKTAMTLRDLILDDKPSTAILDFKGIIFVTRAFADELLKVKALLGRKRIAVEFIHSSPPVTSMFKIVI